MPDTPVANTEYDARAQRMPNGPPKTDGAAIAPRDTAIGTVKPIDCPMAWPGTEAYQENDA